MAKYLRNSGRSWLASDGAALRRLAAQNTPTRVIGLQLGRSEAAVRTKASDLNVSLKPTNQSPYGTGGKKR
ncbi:MAG: hypothetical protein JWO36_2251 [Myxococcales bacterium]|nr:hypothetical protein [Myxococcales bacterium]